MRSIYIQKRDFHGQEYRRAAAQSAPLSYCFGTTTSGEPSTWLPLGKLEGQAPPDFHFSFFRFFQNLKEKKIWFFNFLKKLENGEHFWKFEKARKNNNESGEALLPFSSPSGNQVDGLPPVSSTETVAKRARRGGCTHMRRAMEK